MNPYQTYGHIKRSCHELSDYLESTITPRRPLAPKLETQREDLKQLLEKFRTRFVIVRP